MADNNPKSTARRHIDENLRRIYDETLNEQLPDRLTRLVEQLRLRSGVDVPGPDLPDDDGEGQA